MLLVCRAKLRILAGQAVLALLLLIAVSDTAVAAPKRVLLLHSFAQDIPPWSEYSKSVRATDGRRSRPAGHAAGSEVVRRNQFWQGCGGRPRYHGLRRKPENRTASELVDKREERAALVIR
jgi:hypothetical protein